MFRLSHASLAKLEDARVDPRIRLLVKRAIELTETDFVVFETMRTLERQRELVAKGVSKTLDSYHLTGHAVDLVPWIAGRAQWQAPACLDVALAMRAAAIEAGLSVTWGGTWQRLDRLGSTRAELSLAVRQYTNRVPHGLVDLPHFQVARPPTAGKMNSAA